MWLFEYQAKEILAKYGIKAPEGTVLAADSIADGMPVLPPYPVAVKPQLHIPPCDFLKGWHVTDAATLNAIITDHLGKKITAHETGHTRVLHKLLVERSSEAVRKVNCRWFYDMRNYSYVLEVADCPPLDATKGEILRELIDPMMGIMPFQVRRLAVAMKLPIGSFTRCMVAFIQACLGSEVREALLSPLCLDASGDFHAENAFVDIDSNALLRLRPQFVFDELDDLVEIEYEARKNKLHYAKLDGHIGCLTNGAGLGMITVDMLNQAGVRPSNFLDIGAGATDEQMKAALDILLNDPDVKVIFINIFGGMLRCDLFANSMLKSIQNRENGKPIIIRLRGANADAAYQTLRNSGAEVAVVEDIWEGALLAADILNKTRKEKIDGYSA